MKNGTSTINEISDISLIIKRMGKAELDKREKTLSYNRYKITITEKGIRLFETMLLNSIDVIFSVLSSEGKKVLIALLEKLDKKTRYVHGLDYIPPSFR